MKRLAVIPARGGSKRIPHKNVKDFCGQPMISHAIQIAEQSGMFDTIHVSTDDNEISSIAAKCGHAPGFVRPDELSDDHASMMEVIRYVVLEYEKTGKVFDTVALLYATSPLTDPKDVANACTAFEKSDQEKAFLAVTPYPAPIEHAFRIQKNDDLVPNDKNALAMRTQDLNHAYYDAGMFAVYTPDYIKNNTGSGDFLAFRGYKVPSERVIDIDWPEDWDKAEALYKALQQKN